MAENYQLMPSLQEYVLVSQAEARVERYRRLPSGAWKYSDEVILGDTFIA